MRKIACLITGPCGAGKSTVADELCKRFDKTASINVDYVREMIKNGYTRPFPKTKEADRQISLATENACILANNFLKSGFNVFIDDVVISKEHLDEYYHKIDNLLVFILLPNKNVLEKRDKTRGKEALNERALELHDKFNEIVNNRKWNIIDSSEHNIGQTVKEIMKIIVKSGESY